MLYKNSFKEFKIHIFIFHNASVRIAAVGPYGDMKWNTSFMLLCLLYLMVE